MRLAADQWVAAFESLPLGRSLWLRGLGISMKPLLWSGDQLLVQRCAESELKPGDIAIGTSSQGLTAHVVREVNPLVTASLRGFDDRLTLRVLGRATQLDRGGVKLPINALSRAALKVVTQAAVSVRKAPWAVEQIRLAREATTGPATRALRKLYLGEISYRRLHADERDATLLFLGDHLPDLVGYANHQFDTRWQRQGAAFGAFSRRGLCGFVFIDEYTQEGVPLEGFWIRALFVAPLARGLGVGKGLVDQALQFGREAPLAELYADVREENEPSRRLFEGAGFVADPALTKTLNAQRTEGRLKGWWIGYRRPV